MTRKHVYESIPNRLVHVPWAAKSVGRLRGLIVQVRVAPRRTVDGDIDRCFDNLSGSHHQSHLNCVWSVYGIYVSAQLSRDVIGCLQLQDYIAINKISG